ncbi:hypothetical protein ScPMuIL_014534 [Solemya velum]
MAASMLRRIVHDANKLPIQVTFSKAKQLLLARSVTELSDRPNPLNKDDYPSVEISTEDFKYVERLLPNPLIPDPPNHEVYPTPSGWQPPQESALDHPYFINRTSSHHLPLYLNTRAAGRQRLTTVRKIDGDIWKFEEDLRHYLETLTEEPIITQVHEVARFVRVKGYHLDDVAKFLMEKGF